MQKGGNVSPYRTSDPADYARRKKSYDDSSAVYNSYLENLAALKTANYEPQKIRGSLFHKDPREGQMRNYQSDNYADWFSHMQTNSPYKKNVPGGKYLLQDLADQMVNTNLPYQLFDPNIKPSGVNIYTDPEIYAITPSHMKIRRAVDNAIPWKQDIRPLYNYENARPIQEVQYNPPPVVKNKPTPKIVKKEVPIPIVSQPVPVPEKRIRYQYIREDSHGVRESPVMDERVEPEWFNPDKNKYQSGGKFNDMKRRIEIQGIPTARNAAKWHHQYGGLQKFVDGGDVDPNNPWGQPQVVGGNPQQDQAMQQVYQPVQQANAQAMQVDANSYANRPQVSPDSPTNDQQINVPQQPYTPQQQPQRTHPYGTGFNNALGAGLAAASWYADRKHQREMQGYQRQQGMTDNVFKPMQNSGSHGNYTQQGNFRPDQMTPTAAGYFPGQQKYGGYQNGQELELDEKTIAQLRKQGYKIDYI